MKKVLIFIVVTAICTLFAIASSDGNALYKKCKSCHGASGEKVAMKVSPILKGQSASDIEMKLKGYANDSYGGKKKSIMQRQVKKLSDADIKVLADYISKF